MPREDDNTFESEEFLLQIHSDHLLYAEKSNVLFDFREIARVRIHRKKPDGQVDKITYRLKGQLTSFQIDGFGDSKMERIAALLKERASVFSIPLADPGAP